MRKMVECIGVVFLIVPLEVVSDCLVIQILDGLG